MASTGGADSSFFLDFACALAVTDNIAVLTWQLLHVNLITVLILGLEQFQILPILQVPNTAIKCIHK